MKKITLLLMTALFALNASFAAVIYVDDDAAGANDGSSWTDAYTDLQSAIDAAATGDEIWIAYGIYRPSKDKTGNASPTNPRTKTFYLNKNIAIYGSFNGTETSLAGRVLPNVNPFTATAADVTILSGDLDNDENDINVNGSGYLGSPESATSQNNAYSVVHIGTSAVALYLDGCVITAGSAFNYFGGTNEQVNGGGMYNEGTPTIASCYFGGNFSYENGAGLYSSANITIAYSSFFANFSYVSGGAAYNNKCNATFLGTSFVGNSAYINGGAIYNNGGGASPITCTLVNAAFLTSQSSTGSGGTIYNNGTSNTCVNAIVNCSFTGGAASAGSGGVMYSTGSVVNSIYNSIFYSNTASTSASNVFYNNGFGAATAIEYSLVQGTSITNQSTTSIPFSEGNGMIYNKDPQITSIAPFSPDLTLKSNSPCINAGSNAILMANGITTDIFRNDRFSCGTADMGTSERGTGKGFATRNRAINLDGLTSYVGLGSALSSFNTGSDFTIETWMRVDAFDATANKEIILSNRSGNTGATFFIVGEQDATNKYKLALQIGTSETVYGSGTIPVNEWTHVAVTFDYVGSNNNIVRFYINGALDATFNLADNISASSANTYIAFETGSSDYTDSRFEELRIWNTVRTTNEIRKKMRLLLSCGGEGILANYQFNGNIKNTIELSAAADGNYTGTAVGSVNYGFPTFPLSSGCSELATVSGATAVTVTNSDGLGFTTNFLATNYPNGDVVLTYLEENFGGDTPINADLSLGGQFVVDNYSTDTTGLDYNITMNVANSVDLSNGATNYALERRAANSVLGWEGVVVGTSVNNTAPKSITFNVTGSELGQLMPTFGTVLPVEMTVFTANLKGTQVYLDWQTASEENNLGFNIEKSTDGRNWEMIGFVEGAGTTFEVQTYQFIDNNPISGVNYYRLKQTDFDDKFEYSEIRTIVYGKGNDEIAIYPNPTQSTLTVDLGNNEAAIRVFDITGRLVINKLNNNKGIQTIDFSSLENGIYFVQINGGQWQKIEKIVVQH